MATTAVHCEETPLAGTAFINADAAYTAYKNHDYATAIAKVREAIALRPDSMRLRLLLIDALAAQGNFEEADAVVTEAVSRFGNESELMTRQRNVRELVANKTKIEAFNAADRGFKEFTQKDYPSAIRDARAAIAIDPSKPAYRKLLVNSLIAAGDLDEANKEVTEALTKFADDAELLDRQRYIRQQIAAKPLAEAFAAADAAYKAYAQKDYATAISEAQKAIDLDPSNRAYRDLLENARRAQKQPRTVTVQSKGVIYAQRGYADQRRGDYRAAISDFMAALRSGLPTQAQTRNVRLAIVDSYLGARDPQSALDALAPFGNSSSYDVAARRGYALQALNRREEALEAFQIATSSARSRTERADMLAAHIGMLVELGRRAEALSIFRQALDQGEFASKSAADIAFLASQVGDDQLARVYFGQARHAGRLSAPALQNAAYAAKRLYYNDEAIEYFREAIDANTNGTTSADPQGVFALRREVADLSRTWGFNASITDSRVGSGPGFFASPAPAAGWALQGGAELYWRPPVIGNLNGSTFDVVVRAFETIDAKNGPTGGQTAQGMTGVRWKPFGTITLVFEADKVFKIGRLSNDDWLLRTAFFHGVGTDLRVDVPTWPTWQIYADFNHFVNIHENIASADLRIGQSFRLDAVDPHLVLFPHIGFFANYDNKLAIPQAYAVGPGVTLRYWFREDRYTAPMSYVDLTAQYRFRLGGDQRAEGIFAQALVNY